MTSPQGKWKKSIYCTSNKIPLPLSRLYKLLLDSLCNVQRNWREIISSQVHRSQCRRIKPCNTAWAKKMSCSGGFGITLWWNSFLSIPNRLVEWWDWEHPTRLHLHFHDIYWQHTYIVVIPYNLNYFLTSGPKSNCSHSSWTSSHHIQFFLPFCLVDKWDSCFLSQNINSISVVSLWYLWIVFISLHLSNWFFVIFAEGRRSCRSFS